MSQSMGGKSGVPYTHWQPFAAWSEQQRAKFKAAVAEQRTAKIEQSGPKPRVAIHDDAPWRGKKSFDIGLRVHCRGRTHAREQLAERNRLRAAQGDPPIFNVGDASLKDFGID